MKIIANYKNVTGEGPIWHASERKLYWVDIPKGYLYAYDPETGRHEKVFEGPQIGGITVQRDGALLLFMERGTISSWDGERLVEVVEGIEGEEDSRFNDVISSPDGSVFCGTMPTSSHGATLYRLNTDGSIIPVVMDLGISNGLGFNSNLTCMYHTDSTERTIYRYQFNSKTSELSCREKFITTPNDGSIPDGMTVDSEDHLWSARWDGSAIYRYTPEGNQIAKIDFATKKVSCPTFGGTNYSEMYVTTAGGNDPDSNGKNAGALFKLDVGIKGKPEFLSSIKI